MGRPTIKSLRERTSSQVTKVTNLVRRYVVKASTGALWKLVGLIDGEGNVESETAELWPGIGFWARPPSSGAPEVIVNLVGAATGNPAIVATRDEKTRAALAKAIGGTIDIGETVVFNGTGLVWLKNNGTIEVRSWTGAAAKLPTFADLQALRDWVAGQLGPTGHSHASLGAPPTLGVGGTTQYAGDPADPVGTKVIKGE